MTAKLPWMKLGAPVMAGGLEGRITAREIKKHNDKEFVYWFKVLHPGDKFSKRYLPPQVAERVQVPA